MQAGFAGGGYAISASSDALRQSAVLKAGKK